MSLSFPAGNEMFQFPAFALITLCVQVRVTEGCSAGFPHSEISGSTLVCQFPGAFRRLPRLSSPLDAKTSTMHPSELDHNYRSPSLSEEAGSQKPGARRNATGLSAKAFPPATNNQQLATSFYGFMTPRTEKTRQQKLGPAPDKRWFLFTWHLLNKQSQASAKAHLHPRTDSSVFIYRLLTTHSHSHRQKRCSTTPAPPTPSGCWPRRKYRLPLAHR